MPIAHKVFCLLVILLIAVVVCKATARICTPWVCDVCSFTSSEYKDLKDRLPEGMFN